MLKDSIAIFGYGNHGKFIANGLLTDSFTVTVIESDETFFKNAQNDGFKAILIDVTKDSELKKIELDSFSKLVCVMDDEHLNVFVTLSLRSLFKDAYILSISDSLNVTRKLQMAGANKVIDLYEVSANKIYNILEKPIATKLLEDFISNKSSISFREIVIPNESFLDGIMAEKIDFSSYGVLLVGMIDKELGNAFVFITAGISHKLDSGDTIVCLGEKIDLDKFEELIKSKEDI